LRSKIGSWQLAKQSRTCIAAHGKGMGRAVGEHRRHVSGASVVNTARWRKPMPQIAVINESTVAKDADVQNMLSAFDQQWNKDLLPVWGVDQATFKFVPKGTKPAAGSWWLVFLDDSDQAGALAYHDLTNEGLPISKVFVRTL